MAKPRKKEYQTGDQLHFIITEDFVETANAFFDHCDEEMLNASSVIRKAMTQWLDRAKGKEGSGPSMWEDIRDDTVHESSQIQAHPGWIEQENGRAPMREQRVIEQMFLIYKDGALLAHATSHVTPNLDMDIFSSMLTLIQGFVTESFKDMKDTSISMIEFGDKNILIEPARNLEVILAIVYSGEEYREDVENIAKAIHYELEFTFGKKLKDFDGNLDKVRGIREVMVNHI
ncbi:MAG: hypothetical protein KAS16_04385 [Thermoplasmata archaeon]|nr:hypothetical protein [Thermoplasmata archaeon]